MTDTTLTSEQEKFLAKCEEEFKVRYTEKDSNFMKIKTETLKKPPIVDPWYSKPRRSQYNWTRQDQNKNRNRRNDHWDRRNNDRSERWERHAGKHHMYHRQRMY